MSMADNSSPPPPPYECSQQELDRKVARAIEASISEPSRPPDEDDFVYSEAAFEAAFQAAVNIRQSRRQSQNAAQSSSLTSHMSASQSNGSSLIVPPHNVQPLRINKRTPAAPANTTTPSQKQRPSWLDCAEADPLYSQPSSSSTQGVTSYPGSRMNSTQSAHSIIIPPSRSSTEIEQAEIITNPPPSFAASSRGSTVDLLTPYHGDGSNPPSPLGSPTQRNNVPLAQQDFVLPNPHDTRSRFSTSQLNLPDPHFLGSSNPSRMSLPPPATTPRRTVRPATAGYSLPASKGTLQQPPPQMDFDPRLVYNRPASSRAYTAQPMEAVNAASFYNSAVSAHMPMTPLVNRTSHMNNRQTSTSPPQRQQPQYSQPLHQQSYMQQPSYAMYQPNTSQIMNDLGQPSGVYSGWDTFQ